MTGMQTAKLKAEANGRKAKVLIPCIRGSWTCGWNGSLLCCIEELSSWLYSLPTHTMSYWSKLGINLSPAVPDVNMERVLGSSRRKTFDRLGITH